MSDHEQRITALEEQLAKVIRWADRSTRLGPAPTVDAIRPPSKSTEQIFAEANSRRDLAHAVKEVPPVDRSSRTMTDGSPVTDDHREINLATGMQKGYVVLSAEERAKGFVRPVRRSYVHVGAPAPKYPLTDLDPVKDKHHIEFGYVKRENYTELEDPLTCHLWMQEQLNEVGKGCGTLTTMSHSLAETYARDPLFYSGTFCAGCSKHYKVEQFVWAGDGERVGS